VPAAAECVRHPAAAWCLPLSWFIYSFTINLLFISVFSGSMRQASCWSCHYLFVYLLFSACSSSLREASCGSTLPAIIVNYYFLI
jgi:hypothetical protein